MSFSRLELIFDILTYICHNVPMQTTARTTMRIEPNLKDQIQRLAQKQNMSMQALCNLALRQYIDVASKKRAKKIVFHSHDLGVPLDNLNRDDIYDDPKF